MAKPDDKPPSEAMRQRLERLETIAAEQQRELNQLREAGAARLAQTLGLDTPKKRRQVLQILGTAGAVGAVGAGGFVAGTETARADAVAADVGTSADPWRKVYTHAIESGDGATELTIDDAVTFSDQTADPTSNGEFSRNGADMKVFSGGSVRNMSNIGSGGGGTTFIESQTPSGVSTADFTSSFGDHQTHIFYIQNLIPATDSVDLFLRTSTDGGNNWDSGASDYSYATQRVDDAGNTQDTGSGGDSKVDVSGGGSVGSASGEDGVSATVAVYGTGLAKRTLMSFEVVFIGSGGRVQNVSGSGLRDAAEDVTGVRFLFGSGNIESGTIEHLGVN